MEERFLKYVSEDLTSRLSLFDCRLDVNQGLLGLSTVPGTF